MRYFYIYEGVLCNCIEMICHRKDVLLEMCDE